MAYIKSQAPRLWDRGWHRNGAQSVMRSTVGTSPLQVAPPFRELHLRYNVEDLAESLGEGILVGHPSMPVFRFDPDQIENLIAYLKTLEQR
jgi:mono/diheme cytochrome c family protein